MCEEGFNYWETSFMSNDEDAVEQMERRFHQLVIDPKAKGPTGTASEPKKKPRKELAEKRKRELKALLSNYPRLPDNFILSSKLIPKVRLETLDMSIPKLPSLVVQKRRDMTQAKPNNDIIDTDMIESIKRDGKPTNTGPPPSRPTLATNQPNPARLVQYGADLLEFAKGAELQDFQLIALKRLIITDVGTVEATEASIQSKNEDNQKKTRLISSTDGTIYWLNDTTINDYLQTLWSESMFTQQLPV
ncbi:hypothetical protein SAMD00019534_062990 [Acytostelium subglobosum LB1]|uniref:hypothetical protein n=1 Tax=Acytostelium subglobosum LB1 TaxID=1410327 RepID=UPI000644A6E7|nr:hypothetical protein SAMD00019534_062990 [Acytostelium subglobosum LB1]GAM23124.1 hypothetical protein SAMD00019534_062990 [Acytostelium subglobosum LB1]|eukprot:XP_012754351.1 hypothetical protein SAMD00019534_062990 [Acytostelium subglobosum LB1]